MSTFLCRASLPSKELTAPPNLMLSANLLSMSLIATCKALMKTLKRTGPRMEPSGTPLVTAWCHPIHHNSFHLTCGPAAHPLPPGCSAVCWTFQWRCALCGFFITIPYAGAGSQLAPPFINTCTFVRQEGSRCHHCWGSCQPLTCPHSAWHPLPALVWFGTACFSLWRLPTNSSTTHDGWSNFHSLWSKFQNQYSLVAETAI